MAFTYFFRDAEPLELAIEQMLPLAHALDHVEIWDAGCAHGPEPYTLAILCREKMSPKNFEKVRIHASDVDSCFATQVGEGIFPESELRRLPTGFREKYFRPLDASNTFGVIDEIRSKIFFTHHDLLSLDPLQKNFSLVVCKNVLLHFNDQQRRDVLRMFHSALRLEGVLVTEHTQKMPAELGQMYRQLVRHAQVYAKEPGSAMPKFRKDEPANVGRPHFMKNAIESKPKKKPFEKNAGETA